MAAAGNATNPNDPSFQPALPSRQRSNTWSLANPLNRRSNPPQGAPGDAERSNIPPSPDDIDPTYIQARNRYNQQVVDFLDAVGECYALLSRFTV